MRERLGSGLALLLLGDLGERGGETLDGPVEDAHEPGEGRGHGRGQTGEQLLAAGEVGDGERLGGAIFALYELSKTGSGWVE